jgi:hypothetical protein
MILGDRIRLPEEPEGSAATACADPLLPSGHIAPIDWPPSPPTAAGPLEAGQGAVRERLDELAAGIAPHKHASAYSVILAGDQPMADTRNELGHFPSSG